MSVGRAHLAVLALVSTACASATDRASTDVDIPAMSAAPSDVDPAAGTLLNLAKCEEQLGDTTGTCTTLRQALPMVNPGDAREQFIREWGKRMACGLP